MSESILLYSQKIEDIINEIESHYSLENSEAYQIVINCISKVYKSDYPVLLEEDGIYAVYKDRQDNKQLNYVKIKYSKQKSKLILQNVKKAANDVFLKAQRVLVIDFIKQKKNYLHASFSYETGSYNIYNLYFDKNFKHMAQRVKAIVPKKLGKKSRVYIDFTSAYYDNEFVMFRELKNYKTLKNAKEFTRDISREVYEKTQKRVWIEVKSINLNKKAIYVHLPYKTTLDVVEYIKLRFLEVFELNVVLVGSEN